MNCGGSRADLGVLDRDVEDRYYCIVLFSSLESGNVMLCSVTRIHVIVYIHKKKKIIFNKGDDLTVLYLPNKL